MARRAELDRYSLESVDRMLLVLHALEQNAGSSLDAVARTAGLSEATALRYLSSLSKHDLVERDTESGEYRLGLTLFRLGNLAMRQRDIGELASPLLEGLRDRFAESVNFASKQLGQVMLVRVLESQNPVRKGARAGEIDPWHCTALGKALLGAMDTGERDDVLADIDWARFTPNTHVTRPQLDRDLEGVRARAYAIDDEESVEGLRCVGVSVTDHSGEARFAISVSGPKSRMPFSRLEEIGEHLKSVAADLSRTLAGTRN
jgi:IclR family acetate operon transcriptional repressor